MIHDCWIYTAFRNKEESSSMNSGRLNDKGERLAYQLRESYDLIIPAFNFSASGSTKYFLKFALVRSSIGSSCGNEALVLVSAEL